MKKILLALLLTVIFSVSFVKANAYSQDDLVSGKPIQEFIGNEKYNFYDYLIAKRDNFKEIKTKISNNEVVVVYLNSIAERNEILKETLNEKYYTEETDLLNQTLPKAISFVSDNNEILPIVYHVSKDIEKFNLKEYIVNQVQGEKLNEQKNNMLSGEISFTHGFSIGSNWQIRINWVRNDYIYTGKAGWLRGTYNLFSISEYIAVAATEFNGVNYYEHMTEISVSPDLKGYGYGLQLLDYAVNTKLESNVIPAKLWDYAPKSTPKSYTETYSFGTSADSEGKVTANVGGSYSTEISDVSLTNNSIASDELMKLTYNVNSSSNYGKHTTTFNFLTITQSTSDVVYIRRELNTKFNANDISLYIIDWKAFYGTIQVWKN